MSHPNQYPEKSFVPYDGDMPVETRRTSGIFPEDREGIQGVGFFPSRESADAALSPASAEGDYDDSHITRGDN